MNIIEVSNLSKKYYINKKRGLKGSIKSLFDRSREEIVAVDNISFNVKKGEIVGYIGANGAGKSTTIKMLTGVLIPTEGSIIVNGLIPYKNRKKNAMNVGAVFGQRSQLLWDLPVEESFELQKYLYSVSNVDYKKQIEKFKDLFDLGSFFSKPVRQLSLGQRMRADVCLSLIHNPSILYLDEPTIGLDVLSKEQVRKLILEMNKQYGTTVILTTHDMFDIEDVCNRIMIIDKGKLLFDGDKDSLKEKYNAQKIMKVELSQSIKDFSLPMANVIKQTENQIIFSLDKNSNTIDNITELIEKKLPIRDIQVINESIEDVIKKIYK